MESEALYIEHLKNLVKELLRTSEETSEEQAPQKSDEKHSGESQKQGKENLESSNLDSSESSEEISKKQDAAKSDEKLSKESQQQKEALNTISETWLLFANSIMSGEFLSHKDYSRDLDDIIRWVEERVKKIKPVSDADINNTEPSLHPILFVIHDLCFKLRTLCMLMRIQIKIEDKNDVWAISSPSYQIPFSPSHPYAELSLLTNGVKILVEYLIDMTEIDFTCRTSEEKLKMLCALFHLCGDLAEEKPIFSTEKKINDLLYVKPVPKGTTIEMLYGKYLFQAIQCKCSLLAYQSAFKIEKFGGESIDVVDRDQQKSSKHTNQPIWLWSNYNEKTYRAVGRSFFILNGERYSSSWMLRDVPLFSYWKKNLFNSTNTHAPKDLNRNPKDTKHISQYNEYIMRSKGNRDKFQPIIQKIQDCENSVAELYKIATENNILENDKDDNTPLDFLIVYMRKVEQQKTSSDNYEDNHKRVELLGALLLHLHHIKKKYKRINQPYEQIRLFEDSFFTYEPGKPSFFIASFGCKFVNPDWLEDIDLRYNRLLRKFRIDESKELYNDAQAIFKNVKAHGKTLETLQKDNVESLKSQQRDYLALLGIFSALIALTISTVTSFRLAETIWDYLVMLGGAYLLIALLVLVLYLRNEEQGVIKKCLEGEEKGGSNPIPPKKKAQLCNSTKIIYLSMAIAALLALLGIGVKSGYIRTPLDITIITTDSINLKTPAVVNEINLEAPQVTVSSTTSSSTSKKKKKVSKQSSSAQTLD